MEKRIQTLCKELLIGAEVPLKDTNFYVSWQADGKVHRQTFEKAVEKMSLNCDSNDRIAASNEILKQFEAHNIFAYTNGPIPAFNNQQGVFNYNTAGWGHDLFMYEEKRGLRVKIASARKSLETQCIGKPTINQIVTKKDIAPEKEPAVSDKIDPMSMVAKVKYSYNSDEYFIKVRKHHLSGEFVTVPRVKNGVKRYKNVKIVECGTMKQSDRLVLARSLGYDDLVEASHEPAADISEAWEDWGGCDPRIIEHEMAEMAEMREAFAPAVDRYYHGDLPDTTDLSPEGF